jgi:YD repeat-containing protein
LSRAATEDGGVPSGLKLKLYIERLQRGNHVPCNRLLITLAALCAAAAPTFALAAETQAYSYDALGRLTKVVASNGRVTEYAYDAANNRTQVTSTGPAPVRVVVVPLLGGLVIPLP